MPVAHSGAPLGPLTAAGPDGGGQLHLDQLLAEETDRFFGEVEPLARTEGVEQFGQDRPVEGRSVVIYQLSRQERAPDHAGGPLWRTSGQVKPTTSRDADNLNKLRAFASPSSAVSSLA